MSLRQLSGLDAGFLALETPTSPMLIGGLTLLDPRTSTGRLQVDDLRAMLAARLDRTVAFRRRLASLPFQLTRPYWIELDPDQVDLDLHVEHTELPEPGGWRELGELMAFELGRPLDRDRPLWQILFVDGLRQVEGFPAGTVALISRVHHAAIDGVSGAEILGALFDDVARGARAAPTELGSIAEPSVIELLARTGRDLLAGPLTLPGVVGRSLLGLAGGASSRWRGAASTPALFTAPRTALNRPISDRRSWAPAFFQLDRLKAVKDAAGATINDVVMAICAGALRSWLGERGELPDEPLVAMVPVSVRAAAERLEAGNLVSAMLVSLATDEPDPWKRLGLIRDAARTAKAAHRAVGARTLVESTELLPFALSGLAVRLYSRLHLAERHRPMFNVVITNVPGPPKPLFVAGARMLGHVGAAPLFDGLGLILPVFSYAGSLTIGVTADRAAVPDARLLAAHLTAALKALEASGALSASRR